MPAAAAIETGETPPPLEPTSYRPDPRSGGRRSVVAVMEIGHVRVGMGDRSMGVVMSV